MSIEKYEHLTLRASILDHGIYLGRLNEKNDTWYEGKTKITKKAVHAVMEHLYLSRLIYSCTSTSGKRVSVTALTDDELKNLREYRKTKK